MKRIKKLLIVVMSLSLLLVSLLFICGCSSIQKYQLSDVSLAVPKGFAIQEYGDGTHTMFTYGQDTYHVAMQIQVQAVTGKAAAYTPDEYAAAPVILEEALQSCKVFVTSIKEEVSRTEKLAGLPAAYAQVSGTNDTSGISQTVSTWQVFHNGNAYLISTMVEDSATKAEQDALDKLAASLTFAPAK